MKLKPSNHQRGFVLLILLAIVVIAYVGAALIYAVTKEVVYFPHGTPPTNGTVVMHITNGPPPRLPILPPPNTNPPPTNGWTNVPFPGVFVVQYAVTSTGQPVMPYGDLTASQVFTVADTDTNYTVAVAFGGTLWEYAMTWPSGSTNDSDIIVTEAQYASTNAVQSVTILRSTNLVQWLPVATNSVTVDEIGSWTDTNAPQGGAFYLIKL